MTLGHVEFQGSPECALILHDDFNFDQRGEGSWLSSEPETSRLCATVPSWPWLALPGGGLGTEALGGCDTRD